jgi:hypothetical protein
MCYQRSSDQKAFVTTRANNIRKEMQSANDQIHECLTANNQFVHQLTANNAMPQLFVWHQTNEATPEHHLDKKN